MGAGAEELNSNEEMSTDFGSGEWPEDRNDDDEPSGILREAIAVWNSTNWKVSLLRISMIFFEDPEQVGKDHNDAAGKPCGVCRKQLGNCGFFKNHNVVFQLINLVESARNNSEIVALFYCMVECIYSQEH